jgi:hypothetical protein
MSTHDSDTTAVLEAVKGSLDGVRMRTPLSRIENDARARRRRRRLASSAGGAAALTALAFGVPALNHSPASSSATALNTQAGTVHIDTVAFTLDSRADGTIHVTWDKQRYFQDRTGLQKALRRAGFPVLIKEGEFCRGPQDDGSLDHSGVGPGVDAVMKGETQKDGSVSIIFTPSAMPSGMQLFIGYLTPAQLTVTHGRPGSVERLVPSSGPLTCTTDAPPANPSR